MINLENKRSFIFRIFLFVLGMFVCCYGIAIITRSNLGTSPISCPSYVATFMTPLTFGMTTFILNALCLLGQIIILKKDFPKIQLIQLPIAMLTGIFMDLSMYLTQFLITEVYIYRLIMVLAGSLVMGLGIALEVYPNLTYMPGEGLVKIISDKYNFDFGKVKVIFDVSLVIITLIMSYTALHTIVAVREGTVISALTVGLFAGMFLKAANIFNKANNAV